MGPVQILVDLLPVLSVAPDTREIPLGRVGDVGTGPEVLKSCDLDTRDSGR